MNYPNLQDGTTFRFTLFRKEDPKAPQKEENLNRKYTKTGREDFLDRVEDDPEVRLDNLDQHVVMIERIESRVTGLRGVVGSEDRTQRP